MMPCRFSAARNSSPSAEKRRLTSPSLCLAATVAEKSSAKRIVSPGFNRLAPLTKARHCAGPSARCSVASISAPPRLPCSRAEGPAQWRAFVKGAKRLKPGDTIRFAEAFSATVAAKHNEGDVSLRFSAEGDELRAALNRHGIMPLPPYIKRPRGGEARDRDDYQ